MIRFLPVVLIALALAGGEAADAWAQAEAPAAECAFGEDCDAASRWGAWGLIAAGALFFAMWFLPARVPGDEQAHGGRTRMTMVRALHRRIEKEMTGWRRLQWPVLGLFFLGLGIATLVGWR